MTRTEMSERRNQCGVLRYDVRAISSSLRLNDFVAVIVRVLDDDEWRRDVHERVLAPRAASLRVVEVFSEDEREGAYTDVRRISP